MMILVTLTNNPQLKSISDLSSSINNGLLEVEILVLFRRGHAYVTPRREAPVGGFDFLAAHQLH